MIQKPSFNMLSVRPYLLMCLVCRSVSPGLDNLRDKKLRALLKAVRKNPEIPVMLRCNVDSVYRYQNPGRRDDTPGGPLFNDKRDLDILQKLGLVPGATRPALYLLERLLDTIAVAEGICGYSESTSAVWRGCPEAQTGRYEKGRAKGLAAIVSPRDENEKAEAKRKSAAGMYKSDTLRIRPHHLMCMACFHGGKRKLAPIKEDNLFEAIDIIRKNPDIPVELVAGCCMICPPCSLYHPGTNRCIGGTSMSLRDEKKDLAVLQKTGLRYGDILSARTIYRRLFDRIHSTTEICGYGDGLERAPEWSVCGGKDGRTEYKKARAIRLGIKGL